VLDLIWGIFDDVADTFRSVVFGGAYSRRRRERIPVPDVRNRPFNEGWEELVLSGFDVTVTRLEPNPAPVMGMIVDQSPPPGTIARRTARVHVSVLHPRDPRAAGRPRPRLVRPDDVEVPDVRGAGFADAWDRLMSVGLLVRVDRSTPDPRPVVGSVLAQDPLPGSIVRRRAQFGSRSKARISCAPDRRSRDLALRRIRPGSC
jgi:hypothetical protein